MKFPVDKCETCGLDLTTAEPAEVNYFDNGVANGTCPNCGRPYFMTEVTPPPSPEPVVEPEVIPEPSPELEPPPEPEPVVEPEPSPAEPDVTPPEE